ncbi:MAG: 16S rRNA (cytosine(967)-C(5))-methyltransferase RsmB [Myxococcota bacterium]
MADPARDAALEALRRVFTQGAFAGAALRGILGPGLDDRDRGLATELVYGVLRRRVHLDKAISALGRRLKDIDPKLHDVLRLAAYQLLFLDRIPAHAAVSAAVDQARARRGEGGAKQTNAMLRKLSEIPKESRLPPPPPFAKDPIAHLAFAGGLPRALAEQLASDLGAQKALEFAVKCLDRAPLVLRVNALKTTREALLAEVDGTAGAHPLAVHLPERLGAVPADLLPVAEGRATPQDEASMRVVDLLAPEPGESILDVCAAPGGKTTAIAERMGDRGTVLAHDRALEKLPGIRESARRLGLHIIETIEVLPEPGRLFDRVLVDAPCSGLGTLRRHPEIRWRFEAADIDRLARTQASVLSEAAARTKVGGTLVYSVCTVTRREGIEVAERAIPGFARIETLSTSPSEPGAPDGFFAVKWRRER